MQSSMRPRAVLTALATMLAGLALAATAIAINPSDGLHRATMPSGGCPPAC